MRTPRGPAPQLDLFGSAPRAAGERGVEAASPSEELTSTAARLPLGLRLGTSSWSFPGWRGIVYGGSYGKAALARDGLAAYARHPLLRSVGIDRTYYAPLLADELREYAVAVPDDFRFLMKAHDFCTAARFPSHARYGLRAGEANPLYLDAGYACDAVVAPFVEGLGTKGGILLFQFPPQAPEVKADPSAFADRLAQFLGALPKGVPYAVELRDPELLQGEYVDALASNRACHCFNVHPRMPSPRAQATRLAGYKQPALVVRWMLSPRLGYEEARDRYHPFDRLIDEAPTARSTIAALCLRARGRPAYVIANNKAEGSAPLTLFKLAQLIATRQGDGG